MTLKGSFVLLLSLFVFAGQDIPVNKIAGIYGKDGVEFVCLELYDNYRFDMTVSSCSKDENIQGNFKIEDNQVIMTSDQQAHFNIVKETAVEDGPNGIKVTTADPNLLEFVTLAINYQKRIYRLDKNSFCAFEGDIRHLQVHFPGLDPVAINIVSPTPSLELDLEFKHLNAPTMKDQVWTYDKKQLTHSPESGDPITLRRVRKCWFD